MAISRTVRRWRNGTRRGATAGWPLLLLAFAIGGGVGGIALGALPGLNLSDWLLEAPAPRALVANVPSRSFPICSGGGRINCVVDGDTFWLDGTKIRIADIDTPEVGQPSCAAEKALGQRATTRLQELLNAGPFDLQAADRDEDRYGRKLRIVERQGRSLGDTLVAEGLAHRWGGRQQNWC
ncbi:thermonuclease family protein [Devosia sp. A449]